MFKARHLLDMGLFVSQLNTNAIFNKYVILVASRWTHMYDSYICIIICIFIWKHYKVLQSTSQISSLDDGCDKREEIVHAVRILYPRLG